MTDLDAFLTIVKQYAPGVADPTAYFAIRQAAIEFCERTRLWRYEDEVAATGDEDLFAPAGAVIHEIETIRFDGRPLTAATPQFLDRALPEWRLGVDGAPAYYTQTAPDTLRLVPAQAGTVNLYLTLKPSQDADTLPDFMAAQYREIIAHGALGRILLIPNQSFTNPDMASMFGTAFQQRLDALFSKGSTGQMRARVRVRGDFF